MPKSSAALGWVEAEARKVVAQFGYTLVDAELVKESTGRFLRFFIDKEGGVTLDDCEAFHRSIQPRMDEVDYDYMEVSSPGADRPLKKPGDFEKAKGMRVEIRFYRPFNGQKVISGELIGFQDGEVAIVGADGSALRFAQKQVALVRPVVEWDENERNGAIPEDGKGEK